MQDIFLEKINMTELLNKLNNETQEFFETTILAFMLTFKEESTDLLLDKNEYNFILKNLEEKDFLIEFNMKIFSFIRSEFLQKEDINFFSLYEKMLAKKLIDQSEIDNNMKNFENHVFFIKRQSAIHQYDYNKIFQIILFCIDKIKSFSCFLQLKIELENQLSSMVIFDKFIESRKEKTHQDICITVLQSLNKLEHKSLCDEFDSNVFQDIKEVTEMAITDIENRIKNISNDLSTGYSALDLIIGGLKKGEVTIIAARPSVGKTSLAMNICSNIALSSLNKSVCVFSLEMPAHQLIQRMIFSESKVDKYAVYTGKMNSDQSAKIRASSLAIKESKIFINDESNMTAELINKKLKIALEKNQLFDLLIIDYLQLLRLDNKHRSKESKNIEVSEISYHIKNLSKEFNIPVILLSQLNRDVEKRNNSTPKLSDLRDSGSIEQDADIVLLLNRDNEKATITVAKNRNGATGVVSLYFNASYTRFV